MGQRAKKQIQQKRKESGVADVVVKPVIIKPVIVQVQVPKVLVVQQLVVAPTPIPKVVLLLDDYHRCCTHCKVVRPLIEFKSLANQSTTKQCAFCRTMARQHLENARNNKQVNKTCANVKCNTIFTTHKTNKVFCSNECASVCNEVFTKVCENTRCSKNFNTFNRVQMFCTRECAYGCETYNPTVMVK